MAQVALWGTSGPEAAPDDYAAQARNQAKAFMGAVLAPRAPLEERAGGNFSWNTGVDYAHQLEISGRGDAVRALYRAASLDLKSDLDALAKAPRIAPDAAAVAYMKRFTVPSGDIKVPVLTVASTGDDATTWAHQSALFDAVRSAGNQALLRQTVVRRAGHCVFSPGEVMAAIAALEARIQSGAWPDTSAKAMNASAASHDAAAPAFTDAVAPAFPRPCTTRAAHCDGEIAAPAQR